MKDKNTNNSIITSDNIDETVNSKEKDVIDQITTDTSDAPAEEVTPVEATEDSTEEDGVLVLEGENPEEEPTQVVDNGRPATYMPRFTEVSEKYRRRGDAKIRERLGIKNTVDQDPNAPSDEIRIDPTAEFEEDIVGVADAKEPANTAIDESDESISVVKVATPEDELEAEAAREREEIKKLLGNDSSSNENEPEVVETESEDVEPDEVEETESEEYELPDPDADEIKVFEFVDKQMDELDNNSNTDTSDNGKKKKIKKKDKEFSNPIQRDGIKDRFLDSLISIRIRTGASIVFAFAMLALEVLAATKKIGFNFFNGSENYSILALVDFLLGACMFLMAAPELVGAIKNLFNKKTTTTLIPIPIFVVFGLYTLTIVYGGATSYTLLGLLFASSILPVLNASLYRTKADFIAFKMIAQPEDKQVIDIQNTRDHDVENKALDGAVDEYKSKFARTFSATFISDFFKNSEPSPISGKHFGIICGIPFGIALVVAAVWYFLSTNFVGAMTVFALITMLGCPAFAVLGGKVSFFHSQRAALGTDSTVIGESAYQNFSGVDVFTFDDTDIFGPEDVNLKRFMLYGDRDNMDKVMRQMCALFAAVGGPLDYMFSGIIDNRMRHKTASNVIIEDDGICGEVAGHRICAGSEDYMRRNGIAIPQAAMGRDSESSFDTIKIMYAAEDGEVNAKFYIRYSFSEEFTSIIPSLRDSGIIPLIYTRDPNVSCELLSTLTAGNGTMRVVKLYDAVNEVAIKPRENARMVTYGDRLDAASMIVLAKKYHRFTAYLRFAEVCAMVVGVALAVALAYISRVNFKAVPMAALWHLIMCGVIRMVSKMVFLKESKKKHAD